MNNLCLIIQGPSLYVNLIKEKYKNINIQIIFSTWEGEENKYNHNDLVLFNKIPKEKGIQNVMLQQLSTYNGLLKAKELGFKNTIKIRSDSYFTDIDMFLKKDINYDKINFLYFLDYYRIGGPDKKNNIYKYFYDFMQIECYVGFSLGLLF